MGGFIVLDRYKKKNKRRKEKTNRKNPIGQKVFVTRINNLQLCPLFLIFFFVIFDS